MPLSVVTTANRNVFMASLYSHKSTGYENIIVSGLLYFCLQPVQIIPVVIIRGHEEVLSAEIQHVEFMDLHWDVIITSAKEAMFLSVMFLWTIFSEV